MDSGRPLQSPEDRRATIRCERTRRDGCRFRPIDQLPSGGDLSMRTCIGWPDSSPGWSKPTRVTALEALSQKSHDEPSCLSRGWFNPLVRVDQSGALSTKCKLLIAFPLAPQLCRRNFTFARENNLVPSV